MQPPFCAEFGEWAIPKLVALISSQSLRGQPDVAEAMADFERQPFAQPAFLGNLGEDGAVYVTADALRKRAEHFFKIVTCTAGQALLAAEDDKADDPLVEMTAVALWASTEQPRLRALTHLRLGMSPTVGDSQLPSDFHEQRRVVTQHEFDRLSETERAQWHELARACQQALSRRETALRPSVPDSDVEHSRAFSPRKEAAAPAAGPREHGHASLDIIVPFCTHTMLPLEQVAILPRTRTAQVYENSRSAMDYGVAATTDTDFGTSGQCPSTSDEH